MSKPSWRSAGWFSHPRKPPSRASSGETPGEVSTCTSIEAARGDVRTLRTASNRRDWVSPTSCDALVRRRYGGRFQPGTHSSGLPSSTPCEPSDQTVACRSQDARFCGLGRLEQYTGKLVREGLRGEGGPQGHPSYPACDQAVCVAAKSLKDRLKDEFKIKVILE